MVCNLLVIWSDMLIDVSIRSRIMRSRSTHSQMENYIMSMYKGSDGDLDVVAFLENVDAVLHDEISLAFDRYFQFVVDKVE